MRLEYRSVGVERPRTLTYWSGGGHPDLRFGGYIDIVAEWRETRSWLAVEIDQTNNRTSIRKLKRARDAGFGALWIRWGAGRVIAVPAGIDYISLPMRGGISSHRPMRPQPHTTRCSKREIRSLAWRLSPAQERVLRTIARSDAVSLAHKRRVIETLAAAGLVFIRINQDLIVRVAVSKLGASVLQECDRVQKA